MRNLRTGTRAEASEGIEICGERPGSRISPSARSASASWAPRQIQHQCRRSRILGVARADRPRLKRLRPNFAPPIPSPFSFILFMGLRLGCRTLVKEMVHAPRSLITIKTNLQLIDMGHGLRWMRRIFGSQSPIIGFGGRRMMCFRHV